MNWKSAKNNRFFRFLFTGGLNTALTYALYLILLQYLPYLWSYSISYLTGLIFAFGMSRYFIFKRSAGLKSALLFPLIYVAQYAVGMLIIWAWVNVACLNKELAPLVATAVMVPLTYIATKIIFSQSSGST
jgi:putative flippase GtrA